MIEATAFIVERLESRQLLDAVVLAPQSQDFSGAGPLAPIPAKTFWLNGNNTSGAWKWTSAITPVTTNDLVLNVTSFSQNYQPCCDAVDYNDYFPFVGIGCTGSINAGRLLTNGLTQNQIGAFPSSGQAPASGAGGINDGSSSMSVLSDDASNWWLEYNLANYGNYNGSQFVGGAATNSLGYDLSEIDVIANYVIQADIELQFANASTSDWFSLSNGASFSFTTDQNGTPVESGSAQMAIRDNSGGLLASNVRAVKFVASNNQADFRELVVTGTPSAGLPPAPAAVNSVNVSADATTLGAIDVSFAYPAQPAGALRTTGYLLQRAPFVNAATGTFLTVATATQQNAGFSFVDMMASAGATYVYRVVSADPSGSATSPNSAPIATPPTTVEMHAYNEAFWTGPVFYTQGLAQASITSALGSWGPGIGTSLDSVILTGKVTTNAAGVYTFISNTDDDGYLYVNGVLVSYDILDHPPRDAGAQLDINNNPIGTAIPISLAANTSYDFVLMEHNSDGSAAANMLWITPSNPGYNNRQLVPPANLTPLSDPPVTPTNLTVTSSNSNFVNFTFTANNSGIIDYILQREDVTPGTTNQPWVTIGQIWPVHNSVNNNGAITSVSLASVTIQDAMPIGGNTYIYRVAAVNYENTAYSAPTSSVSIPRVSGSPPAGVEIHMYNGRVDDLQLPTQYPMAQNGLPIEFVPQSVDMSIGTFLPGVIDRDYYAQLPAAEFPVYPSPDPVVFPDLPRVGRQDFAQIFSGKLQVGLSGAYTIISNTDDSGFVWVNGALVSADPGIHTQEDVSDSIPGDTLVPVFLQPGQSYNLTMEMTQLGGDDSAAHLRWIEPRVLDDQTVSSATGLFNGSQDESTITLSVSTVPTFSLVGYTLFITSGTGAGQNASILTWDSVNKSAIVDVVSSGSNLLWTTLPNSTSGYAVALYEPIPLAGADNTNGNTAGGLSMRQDVPVQSSWNPTTGAVNSTSSGSAAGNLAITSIDPTAGITLTWTDQSNSEMWFEVQRSSDGTSWTTVGTTPFDIGTSFTDTSAVSGFNHSTSGYFYRVRGVNFDGAGPFTSPVASPPQYDTISGTSGADTITLRQDPDRIHIDWILNGSPFAQLPITDPNGLTINGNGGSDTIYLDYSNGNPLPNLINFNGTFTINGVPLAGQTWNINRSTIYVTYPSLPFDPIATVTNELAQGYNNGGWNGIASPSNGVIISTPASQNAAQTTAIGYADSADGLISGQPANTIELKYTLDGDTTLSGSVGFNDFTRLTQHYNQTIGGSWDTGDFNYDGSVNSADFTLMTRTYNTSTGSQAVPASGAASKTSVQAKPQSRKPRHHKKAAKLPT